MRQKPHPVRPLHETEACRASGILQSGERRVLPELRRERPRVNVVSLPRSRLHTALEMDDLARLLPLIDLLFARCLIELRRAPAGSPEFPELRLPAAVLSPPRLWHVSMRNT